METRMGPYVRRVLSAVSYAVIAASVATGLLLRSVEVISRNYVFVYDQGLDMMAAYGISVLHKLTLIGAEAGGGFAGLPGIFHGPGYHYLLAALSVLSRGDPYGAMVFLWVAHIAEVAGFYFLGRRLFGKTGGLASAFIAAVSPDFIGMSRVLWAPNFAGPFVLVFLGILLMRRRKSWQEAYLLGIAASGLYHFEIPIAAAAIAGSFLCLLFVERMRRVLLWFAWVCGIVTGVLPLILFDARHGWKTVNGLVAFVLHPVTVTRSAPYDIAGNIRAILFHINGVFPPVSGLPFWFWTAVLAGAVSLLIRSDRHAARKRTVLAVGIVIGIHAVLFVPYRNPVYGHYLTLLSYAIVVAAGYIAARLQESKRSGMVLVLAVLLAAPSLLLYGRTIPADLADSGGTAKIRGKTEAIDAVYAMEQGKPFNLLVFTPPVYTYPYDYLLRWYAQRKYGYLPGNEKKGDTILLIEPDPEKPWSYNGWLETVIKTGTVVSTRTLPNGFIIQKREFPI